MPGDFPYDVIISYSSQDKLRVRRLAQRLSAANLRVWFDDWVIKPGDDIYLAIEHGLENSRTLLLCLSPAALGSDWVSLERSTVLFRNPSNSARRFIPLLLTECILPDSVRRYKYVDFREEAQEAFQQLLSQCTSDHDSHLHTGSHPDATQRGHRKRVLLVVDDDLTPESMFIQLLSSAVDTTTSIELVGSPAEAISICKSGQNLVACITDIVFRRHSTIGGVQVAETAIDMDIPVLVITGHRMQDLGLALKELSRIGVPRSSILKKPVTSSEYERFLKKVRSMARALS
jgi:CheY-like chemotaxis protein